jgi:hypothetical protein
VAHALVRAMRLFSTHARAWDAERRRPRMFQKFSSFWICPLKVGWLTLHALAAWLKWRKLGYRDAIAKSPPSETFPS